MQEMVERQSVQEAIVKGNNICKCPHRKAMPKYHPLSRISKAALKLAARHLIPFSFFIFHLCAIGTMDPAVYLRLATPLVLAAPVLRLLPPPVEPEAELPGIRPITIRIVTPRRTFILLTLTLLAISATLDAARLITEIATSSARERIMYGLPLWSEVVYAFGGLCVWALTAIFIEWRAKWGDRNLVILGVLGILLEVPNLVLAVLRQTHGESTLIELIQTTTSFTSWPYPHLLSAYFCCPYLSYSSRDPSYATKPQRHPDCYPKVAPNTAPLKETSQSYPSQRSWARSRRKTSL